MQLKLGRKVLDKPSFLLGERRVHCMMVDLRRRKLPLCRPYCKKGYRFLPTIVRGLRSTCVSGFLTITVVGARQLQSVIVPVPAMVLVFSQVVAVDLAWISSTMLAWGVSINPIYRRQIDKNTGIVNRCAVQGTPKRDTTAPYIGVGTNCDDHKRPTLLRRRLRRRRPFPFTWPCWRFMVRNRGIDNNPVDDR